MGRTHRGGVRAGFHRGAQRLLGGWLALLLFDTRVGIQPLLGLAGRLLDPPLDLLSLTLHLLAGVTRRTTHRTPYPSLHDLGRALDAVLGSFRGQVLGVP